MRRRHTRQTDPDLYGPAVQRAVRIPETQVDAVQTVIARGVPDIHTVTDAIIDALWLWLYENDRVNGHRIEGGQERGSHEPQTENGQAMREAGRDRTQNSPDTSPATLVLPEATGADHAYVGTQERPKWADVDPDALDVDP